MSTTIRIATFNLENLDDKPGLEPKLGERLALMRPQLVRLRADVLCLQEVNGQEQSGQPRRLLALDQLLAGTPYAGFNRVSTLLDDRSQVYDERNLVILSRFPISAPEQIKHDRIRKPQYRRLTAKPSDAQAVEVTWERPVLYATLDVAPALKIHVINVHLKSRIPTNIPGQQINAYKWASVAGWAEGSFLSSLKRVGQALEVRVLVDEILDADAAACIVVAGDFNADVDDVPLEAIRGEVENTGNGALAGRVLVPCENSVPESARYSLLHRGRGEMLDHLLASRALLSGYRGTEIHNELLHDESIAFASDVQFPESDHAPVVAEFELP